MILSRPLWLIALSLISTSFVGLSSAEEPKAKEKINWEKAADDCWNVVLKETQKLPPLEKCDVDDWASAIVAVNEAFDSMIEDLPGDSRKLAVEHYVSKFGTKGSVEDYLWASPSWAMLPDARPQPYSIKRYKIPHLVQMEASQAIVKRFLDEPNFRERYFYLCLWSGHIFSALGPTRESCMTQIEYGVAGLIRSHPESSDQVWWHLRKVLLILYTVEKQEAALWKSLQKGHYGEQLTPLILKVALEIHFMKPTPNGLGWALDQESNRTGIPYGEWGEVSLTRPKLPFSNWPSKKSPTPSLYRELEN